MAVPRRAWPILASILLLSASPLGAESGVRGAQATVVLESGLGDGADVWRKLMRKLPSDAGRFSYDRPGYGGTAPTDSERDPCTIASELHDRLGRAGQKPPYILVGHSLGGQYAYAFARLYPDEMAGLILVDATPPGHWEAIRAEAPGIAKMLEVVKAISFSGTMRREFAAQDRCLDTLPVTPMQFPVRIVVKTRPDPLGGRQLERIDARLAPGWSRLTGRLRIEPVPHSGHYIQRDQPDLLAAIIGQTMQAHADISAAK